MHILELFKNNLQNSFYLGKKYPYVRAFSLKINVIICVLLKIKSCNNIITLVVFKVTITNTTPILFNLWSIQNQRNALQMRIRKIKLKPTDVYSCQNVLYVSICGPNVPHGLCPYHGVRQQSENRISSGTRVKQTNDKMDERVVGQILHSIYKWQGGRLSITSRRQETDKQ